MSRDIISIIMAAGKGTRMGNSRRHKVCFPVAGVPAVVRAIQIYNACGVTRHCVVVGHLASNVTRTVRAHCPNVFFARQPRQRGSADAVRIAASKLRKMGVKGAVLVVAGDKVIQPTAVRRLISVFHERDCDLAFISGSRAASPTSGILVFDRNHRVAADVEVKVLAKARAENRVFQFASGQRLTPDEIDRRFTEANLSVYLFKAEALFAGLDKMASDDSDEMYFTDIFEALASDPRRVIIPVPVLDATEVMAFNTRAELAVIERVYRDNDSRRSRILPQPRPAFPTLKTVAQWKSAFERGQPALKRFLRQVYSQPSDLRLYESLAEGFGERFGGARKFAIIRAPGRVNLMGRHIDHQGGPTNVIATDHKVLVAAAPRDDDLVRLFNRDHSRFPARTFSIAREISRLDWADWRGLVNGPRLSALLKRTRGDWGNYVKGAVLRLQHHFVERRLRGMDLFVDGNIPAASGLSSSSALVVAAAEAFLSLNQLEMERAQFAEICAEAEWFVGTRQGATDHAAISLGRRDTVLHMGFFPLRVIKTAPLFRGHTFIICNSGQRAGKSGAAHGVYNERVTSYAIGRLMLRRLLSSRQRIGHLTEVNPETLGCAPSAIYQALAKLPDKFTTAKARAWCRTLDTDERAELEPMLDGAAGLVHHVRDICLYGVTECARAREAVRALQDHNPARFGMLMRVSHDGDRIRDAKGKPFRWSTSDAAFARLIKKPVPLWKPTGGYACSTETIDRIVDTAMKLPGVLGAQMVGAGLGGCVIILAQDGSVGKVLSTFRAEGFVTEPLVSTAGVCALVAN